MDTSAHNGPPLALLEVMGVEAGYRSQMILHDVALSVRSGELVVILGPNGAGKSTLAKAITGTLAIRSGEVYFKGHSTRRMRAHELARLGLAYVPQIHNVFTSLTVKENLSLARGSIRAYRNPALALDIFDLFPALHSSLHHKAGALSGGQRQMLAMARAILLGPDLMVLDEPTAGLAPRVREEVFGALLEMVHLGLTLLVVEQNVELALRYCSRAYVLANGRNAYEGSGDGILHDARLRDLYLSG